MGYITYLAIGSMVFGLYYPQYALVAGISVWIVFFIDMAIRYLRFRRDIRRLRANGLVDTNLKE